MSGPNIFISNRMEILAEKLARIVGEDWPPPLLPEIVVVQSGAMARWLALQLARRQGICANFAFPFPDAFLQDIFREIKPDLPETSLFDPDILTFKIMQILPACLPRPGFKTLQTYLGDDADHLKRFQFARKIADLYDQYQIFRPAMLFDWEAGRENDAPDEIWQAQLWRKLVHEIEDCHRARLQKALLEAIAAKPLPSLQLPRRVSLFGISYLPLFHLEVFAALARRIEVNLLLLNPCREYWTDIVSERRLQSIRKRYPQQADIAGELHLEEGNHLLASLGMLGRNFFRLINAFDCDVHELFQDQQCHDMLSGLQSDMLNLKNRGAAGRDTSGSETAAPFAVTPADKSVQFHSCHSPMREVEVLHDNLLAMFDENPQLKPRDVIVMTPDIPTYAPFIHAVFDTQSEDALRIPYGIADQNARRQSALIEGFLALLDLKDCRFSSSSILRLLEYPGIKEKFGLVESDLPLIQRWISDTRIRWGKNATDRRKRGLPDFKDNTWQAGIQRLLLGYAMAGEGRKMFAGILPYDNIEGDDARVLGRFLEFVERVFEYAAIIEKPKNLIRWNHVLKSMLESFFLADDETADHIQTLRQVLEQLADRQIQSGFQDALELEVIRSYLTRHLEKISFGSGFMSGGVTFCAMLPMRSIPFKVVCLIGMNGEAFPRDQQPPTFDLIARHPRPGDRSRRNDDKYLFLEAILSARTNLYISYVGQSIQDNRPIPPSVLVSELLDTLEKGFYLPGQDLREHLITRHRLQPFSAQYFRPNAKLFSYSKENMQAAERSRQGINPTPFIATRLPGPAEQASSAVVDIDALVRFFSNATKFLLKQRLGILLVEEDATAIREQENFSLDPLDRYLIGQDLVRTRMAGFDLGDYQNVQRATGIMPPARPGDVCYRNLSIDAAGFAARVLKHTLEKISEPIEIDINIAGIRLTGRLPEIYAGGGVIQRYARRKAKDLLRAWIYHLVYCHRTAPGWPARTILICRDKSTRFTAGGEMGAILKTLVDLYRRGLEAPLHFFPESSLEYARQMQKAADRQASARASARKKWIGSEYQRGESEDSYYQLCFQGIDPIDDTFAEIALKVYGPLLGHCEEIEA